MRSNWSKVDPKYNVTGIFKRRDRSTHAKRDVKRDTAGESHVKTEAEIGVMYLQTKECQGFLVTTRS